MIAKITDGVLATLGNGELLQFHIDNGYEQVEDIAVDAEGNYYAYYTDYTTPDMDKINASELGERLKEWKIERATAVDNIVVEFNGSSFQGNEKSQDRMSRAINALPDDETTVNWVTSDNSVEQLTKLDLQAILALSGAEQSRLWVEGRPS